VIEEHHNAATPVHPPSSIKSFSDEYIDLQIQVHELHDDTLISI